MKPSTSSTLADKERVKKEKKGHICAPSNASHPRDRWETAFVYAFISKFTNLRNKVEGFECPTDLEDALLSPTQHPVLVQILSRFVLNLKPQTRNLSPDQLSATLSSVLQEYMKSSERTVFWDDELQTNVDPLVGIQGGIWGATWDLKLRILRQLVELQLSHNPETKEIIDRAWGVAHNKHRKREAPTAPPDPGDPFSVERLSTIPLGQDVTRKRYWAFDDSPRLYISTNPWKVTAEFKSIANNKDEYLKVLEDLKSKGKGKAKKLTKMEQVHNTLVQTLESRLETIDAELSRVQKVRRKIEQREILRAQAELRTTRTRRQTRRPDYVYHQDLGSDDDGDDYTYQDDEDDDEHIEVDDDGFGDDFGRRRSQRTSTRNVNGKRTSDAFGDWRGERRSSRLGPNPEGSDGHSSKRARTEERSVSSAPSDSLISPSIPANGESSKNGAASVKPNEVAVEQVAGKKKSKFWFYAVEPARSSATPQLLQSTDISISDVNGHHDGVVHDGGINGKDPTGQNGMNGTYERRRSPMSSMGVN